MYVRRRRERWATIESKQVTDALQNVFTDPKPSVRLMAAASYIRASRPAPEKQKEHSRRKTTSTASARER